MNSRVASVKGGLPSEGIIVYGCLTGEHFVEVIPPIIGSLWNTHVNSKIFLQNSNLAIDSMQPLLVEGVKTMNAADHVCHISPRILYTMGRQ